MKLTAVIIDDNKSSIKLLSKLLTSFFTNVEIVASFNSVKTSIDTILNEKPDIVFLDVEMPGENGFKLFEYISQPEFETIFITAYREYAADAFRMDSADYLVKPIDPAELREAISRVEQKRLRVRGLSTKSKIALQTKTGIEFVNIADVHYCQADDNYTNVYFKEQKRLLSKPLKEIEKLLMGHRFFRSNRSYLVNLDHIKGLTRGRKNGIVISDDIVIPLSIEKKKELLDLLAGDDILNL